VGSQRFKNAHGQAPRGAVTMRRTCRCSLSRVVALAAPRITPKVGAGGGSAIRVAPFFRAVHPLGRSPIDQH